MNNALYHHGIKGQKWGVRRYQNQDGTWTAAGKERYGDEPSGGAVDKGPNDTKKKVAIGVATTAAVVTGTVFAAYMVKKYSGKNISDISGKTPAGKNILQDILKAASVAETPASKIPTPKVEPKRVLEQIAKSASSATSQAGVISAPKHSVGKSSVVSQSPNIETLMRQNDDLLRKMLAELA